MTGEEFSSERKLKGKRKYGRKSEGKRKYRRSSLRSKGSSGGRIFDERFEFPFTINCMGCHSMIAKGVKIIGSKKPVGYYRDEQIFRYVIYCPCCGYRITMDGIPAELKYKVIKGAVKGENIKKSGASRIDFESQKMEHNKKYRDAIVAGSSARFVVPYCIECQGCNSVIGFDAKINGKKISVNYGADSARKIWRYILECPCGYAIVIERTSGDSKVDIKIIDGAVPLNDETSLVDVAYVDSSRPRWSDNNDFCP